MAQDRDIKYVNRDFGDFKSQLVEYAKNYFPDTYNDFSPTSPGMMVIEMAAYIGDVLSFYQDTQLQETYLQYAKNPTNLYNLAYMMGYRPKITSAAEVNVEVSHRVGVDGNGDPDWSQALQLPPNTSLQSTSTGQVKFLIDKPVDFRFSSSYDPTDVTVYSLDNLTGEPTQFTLTKTAKAFSGELKTVQEVINSVEKFKTITVTDNNTIGVMSITDSQGNKWYEVPFLGQDTVYVDDTNVAATDNGDVPYTLALQKVPRRFVTRLTPAGELQIQFGAGVTSQDDTVLTPDPTNVGLGLPSVLSTLDTAYDPSNFLFTKAYGLAPSNTTLTVTYMVGGGVNANIPANTLTNLFSFGGTVTGDVSTLTFNNPDAAIGGRDGDSVEEFRPYDINAQVSDDPKRRHFTHRISTYEAVVWFE